MKGFVRVLPKKGRKDDSNMNKRDSTYVLCWAKRLKAARLLGGRCLDCGESDVVVFDFHHKHGGGKDFDVSRIKTARWSLIEREVRRCVLLCSNCHAVRHIDAGRNDSRRALLKRKLLEYKGVFACEKCGHSDEQYASLSFHHRDRANKIGDINTLSWGSKGKRELAEIVKKELDGCDVVCRNCHAKGHIDLERMRRFWPDIERRSNDHKEIGRVDKDRILSLYGSGMTQAEIVRVVGCSKATVSVAVRNVVQSG